MENIIELHAKKLKEEVGMALNYDECFYLIEDAVNDALKQGQTLPIDNVSNCSHEWKADTFDNIGMALTEYCDECEAKRDCC